MVRLDTSPKFGGLSTRFTLVPDQSFLLYSNLSGMNTSHKGKGSPVTVEKIYGFGHFSTADFVIQVFFFLVSIFSEKFGDGYPL